MIDGRAIIDPGAIVGENVTVGPWSIVGSDVELGDNVSVASHVVIRGPTKIGAGVKIYQFATVGEDTPAFAYEGEETFLEIGANTVIREGVTIHRGMVKGGIGRTYVGRNCLLMAYVHIGHDCVVGDHVIMANNASLAGHVNVGDHANFGGFSGIPQFREVGAYTHVAAMSLVLKDIPAYMTVGGNPAFAVGLNLEGMKRRGYSKETVQAVRQAYKVVYRQGLRVVEALLEIADLRKQHQEVDLFAASIESSKHGIIRGRNSSRQQQT
ncbi:MAG: acyl-ACP--UDP-N-acetylglucosamine O-acyltransferase [Gammaproteobacteria bacterium]|nr:acyl-ACP--UDP-N-acetylglucosamine O-acyltransferase [Gammaproteobacteria bacterium]